jgi:hypothetical protein
MKHPGQDVQSQQGRVQAKTMLKGFSIWIAVMVMLVSTPAGGDEPIPSQAGFGWLHEIRLGVLKHDVDNLWSRNRKESGVSYNGEIIFSRPNLFFLKGMIRPNLGLSVNDQGDTSKVYAGLVWEVESEAGLFLNLGLGATVHNGELDTDRADKKQLGARVLFRIPIEFGFGLNRNHRISIMFDHISNAGLTSPNEGLDTLGLRYGYRF